MRELDSTRSVDHYEGNLRENDTGRLLFYACLFGAIFALTGIACTFIAVHFEGQIWDAFSSAYNALLNLAAAR